jgi:polysaccharide biosynthesis transport protein
MDNDEFDLNGVFETLRRQFALIVLTIALCGGLTLVYLVSVTPIYSSSALIMVDPVQKDLLAPEPRDSANQGTANARVESEAEILKSDAVALSVVRKANLLVDREFGPRVSVREKIERIFGIERYRAATSQGLLRETVDRLKEATEVRRRGLTYLIQVSVSSEVPERSAELTNTLAETYIAQQLEAKVGNALAARDILRAQIAASRAELALSETALDAFIRDSAGRIEQETGRTELSSIVKSLERIEGNRLRAEVRLRQTQEDISNRNWAGLVAGLEDDALLSLERQRAEIEERLGRVAAESGNAAELKDELADLERQIEERAADGIGTLQGQIARLSANEEASRRQLRDTLVSGQLPPDILTEIFSIQQGATISRNQYQNLVARLNDVETRAGVQMADSRIVSPALVPIDPTFPNSKLVAVLGLAFGTGLGILFAFLREYVIGGFTSAEQLQAIAQAPVASTIPASSNSGSSDYLSPADAITREPLSLFAESVRRLRASIDQTSTVSWNGDSKTDIGGKVILVASSVPEEGKTTTSLALARTYALAGKSVLLIDADLRRPTLHAMVGITPESGFSEYLENRGPYGKLKDYFWTDPETDVKLILGKSRSAAPTDRLLSSSVFEQVISKERRNYDVIIIDTSPLLPVVDGRYVAPLADAVVMLVRWASTSQSDVKTSLASLRASMMEGTPLLMVLTQRTEGRKNSYHYEYTYGSAS